MDTNLGDKTAPAPAPATDKLDQVLTALEKLAALQLASTGNGGNASTDDRASRMAKLQEEYEALQRQQEELDLEKMERDFEFNMRRDRIMRMTDPIYDVTRSGQDAIVRLTKRQQDMTNNLRNFGRIHNGFNSAFGSTQRIGQRGFY